MPTSKTANNAPLTNKRLEAARLLDTDEPIGVHSWPLGSYVSEAIENEMEAFTPAEKRRGYDARFTLALRRVINKAAVYAEPWKIDEEVFGYAANTRRI